MYVFALKKMSLIFRWLMNFILRTIILMLILNHIRIMLQFLNIYIYIYLYTPRFSFDIRRIIFSKATNVI